MSQRKLPFFLLLFVLTAGIIFSICSGAEHISISEVIAWLMGSGDLNDTHLQILNEIRLPRTLAAITVGAALAVSGLVLQTVLRNPLAEPYTLGLSGGSCFGVIVVILLNLEPVAYFIPLGSTLGCLVSVCLVLFFAGARMGTESKGLILFGVMVSLFFGALVVTMLTMMAPEKVQTTLVWLLGEFGTTRDPWAYYFLPVLVLGVTFLLSRSHALDVLQLGETRALSLGVSPKKEKLILIFTCSILTAIAVSISGLIGFVGLVAPHICRRVLKISGHFELLLGSALLGASLILFADSLGRVIAPGTEIPAGSLAALIGAPVLVALMFRGGHASSE